MKKGVYLLLIILGCTIHEPREISHPPAEEEISRIVENIREKNFRVKIEVSCPGVKSIIQGEYDKRGRVRVKNEWKINDKKIESEHLLIGNKIFSKEKNKWIESSSSERLPHELVSIVTSFGDFCFMGREKGCFVYEFTPNLLFISPSMENARARLYIDEYTLFPMNITATGNGGYFNAKFSCFGDEIKIEHPLSRIYQTTISPIPDSQDMAIITKRIFSIGADDCWLRGDKLYIKIPETNKSIIKRILKKGLIYIHTVIYPGEPLEIAKNKYSDKLVFLNKVNPVIIDSLLYKGSVDDVIFFEGTKKEIRLNLIFPDNITILSPCLISIDDKPISFFHKFYGSKMEVRGEKVDYSILKFGPLSKEYEIK